MLLLGHMLTEEYWHVILIVSNAHDTSA